MEWIKLSEVRARLHVSENTLRKMVHAPQTSKFFLKVGGTYRCDYAGLIKYLKEN